MLQQGPSRDRGAPGGARRDTCVLAEIVPVVDARRTCLLVALLGAIVALAVPAALGQSAYDKKACVDRKISACATRSRPRRARRNAHLRDPGRGPADRRPRRRHRLALGADLRLNRAGGAPNRLARLREQIAIQTREIAYLKEQYAIAQRHLEERLVELYQSDDADAFGILLQVENLGDLVDQLEYVDSIGRQTSPSRPGCSPCGWT